MVFARTFQPWFFLFVFLAQTLNASSPKLARTAQPAVPEEAILEEFQLWRSQTANIIGLTDEQSKRLNTLLSNVGADKRAAREEATLELKAFVESNSAVQIELEARLKSLKGEVKERATYALFQASRRISCKQLEIALLNELNRSPKALSLKRKMDQLLTSLDPEELRNLEALHNNVASAPNSCNTEAPTNGWEKSKKNTCIRGLGFDHIGVETIYNHHQETKELLLSALNHHYGEILKTVGASETVPIQHNDFGDLMHFTLDGADFRLWLGENGSFELSHADITQRGQIDLAALLPKNALLPNGATAGLAPRLQFEFAIQGGFPISRYFLHAKPFSGGEPEKSHDNLVTKTVSSYLSQLFPMCRTSNTDLSTPFLKRVATYTGSIAK